MLLNAAVTPVAATYALAFVGDPYRYAQSSGADGQDFYDNQALVSPVVFYDSNARAYRAASGSPRRQRPAACCRRGSRQWFVRGSRDTAMVGSALLVRNGYLVLTFDPRGQGRSDLQTPDGMQGSNANPSIFWTGLVDAIDFSAPVPGSFIPTI